MTSTTALLISLDEFQTWPQDLRDRVLERTFGRHVPAAEPTPPDNEPKGEAALDDADDDRFAELSPGQARRFLEKCSPKVKSAIAAIVSREDRVFTAKDVADTLGVPSNKLSGVWSGLTRRTQTITEDSGAYPIYWEQDEEGVYHGEMSEMTHASFRKVLKIV